MFKGGNKYKVKVSSFGLGDGKKGPQPFIIFEGLNGEGTITYYGNLASDKAQEFTVKNFIISGFQGNDWNDLSNPMAFDSRELVIETEEYEGKVKVKYINRANVGPKKFEGQAPKMAAVFAKIKQELGSRKVSKQKEEEPPF